MSDLITLDPILEHPQLRAAAGRTLHVAKLAALKAAANLMDAKAHPLPADPKSLERIFAARLAARPQASQRRAVERVQKVQAAASKVRARMFGDLDKLDLRSATPIATLAAAIPVRSAPAAALAGKSAAVAASAAPTVTEAGSPPPPAPGSPPGKTLALRIHRVICEHTTDDGLWSDDEIKLGGVLIGANGAVAVRSAFKVSDSFVDPGDEDSGHVSSVTYNPPHDFYHWSFADSGSHWPKDYTASLILCEEDEGGFTGFLLDLGNALKDVGESFLAAFGPLGTALNWLLDNLFGWLQSLWEDDPFHPINVHAEIDSSHHTFASGTRTSSLKKYWTTMGIGKYWIYFDWQITT